MALLAGIGIGAAVMYFLDPDRGTRRRHVLADKARRGLRLTGRELHDAAENAKNHTKGKVLELQHRMSEEPVDDQRLVERVRAELGHRVERARAIEVSAENGRVTLTGALPYDQIERATKTAASVRGVREIDNRLVTSAGDQGAVQPEA
ncbi:MAG: BON domain-containing protein [Gemmatimonadaceae bacterium]